MLYYFVPIVQQTFYNFRIKDKAKREIELFISKHNLTKEKAYHYFYGGNKTLSGHKPVKREKIVEDAMAFLGKPYIWGREDTLAVDCSGLVYYVFRKNGLAIPRVAGDQYKYGKLIPIKQLKPADLVFFETYKSGASHVGIYIGNGKYIQALNSRTGVIISRINSNYSRSKFIGGKDVLSL